MKQLPTIVTAPAFRYRIALDGVVYQLVYRYVTRTGNWHLDILASDGTALHTGVKVVRNWGLFGRDVSDDFPPGDIYGASAGSGPVGRDGLRTVDTRVVYLDAAEVAQVNAVLYPSPSEGDVTFTSEA